MWAPTAPRSAGGKKWWQFTVVLLTGALVKNNIFWTGAYATMDASSETSSAYDCNDYFSASGTPFSWGGAAFNFVNWKTNSSQDSHPLNSDPMLTNGGSRNVTLPAGSPAMDFDESCGW
jgi:hypothetical protein